MTYIEFKKILIDLDISSAAFSDIVKISYKNVLAFKKKEEVPNVIAALAVSFLEMKNKGIDYKEFMDSLDFDYKKSVGSGFAQNKENIKIKWF